MGMAFLDDAGNQIQWEGLDVSPAPEEPICFCVEVCICHRGSEPRTIMLTRFVLSFSTLTQMSAIPNTLAALAQRSPGLRMQAT